MATEGTTQTVKMLRDRADISTATLSDVLGSQHTLDPSVTSLVPGSRLVGPAMTVHAYPGSIFTVHRALLEAEPGCVLIVAGGGGVANGALFGELMAREALARGIAGIVVDGAVRDVAGIRELGLPVFACGVTPRVGTNRRIGTVGAIVACAGVGVAPGDVVIGDDNGVAIVPQVRCATIVEDAERLLEKEARMRDGIARGERLADLLGVRDVLGGPAASV